MCFFFPFILDIKFVGLTNRGHIGGSSHRISHLPSFCGARLKFSREKNSAIFLTLVDRDVEFCVTTNDLIVLHYLLCVCVFSSHSFWTSNGRTSRGHTQEEGNTGFSFHLVSAVLALIFLARRIQPFLSLVDREVEFCVLTN